VQITDELPRVFESEPGIELEAVGRDRADASLLRRQTVQTLRNSARFWGEYGRVRSHFEDCQGELQLASF
jgi:hypothetical protein